MCAWKSFETWLLKKWPCQKIQQFGTNLSGENTPTRQKFAALILAYRVTCFDVIYTFIYIYICGKSAIRLAPDNNNTPWYPGSLSGRKTPKSFEAVVNKLKIVVTPQFFCNEKNPPRIEDVCRSACTNLKRMHTENDSSCSTYNCHPPLERFLWSTSVASNMTMVNLTKNVQLVVKMILVPVLPKADDKKHILLESRRSAAFWNQPRG